MEPDWMEQAIARLDSQTLEKLAQFLGLTQPSADRDPQSEGLTKQSQESKMTPAK